MKKYFLDTSVIVAYLRGRKEVIDYINNLEGELSSSFICLSELYEGIFRVKEQEEAEKAVLSLFKGLNEVYGLDGEIARIFGRIRKTLKTKGSIIEDIDLFIAATCIAYNLVLVTLNKKHFEKVPDLVLS